MVESANGMVRPCPRPASSERWQGHRRQGARHVTDAQHFPRRNRHRYRQELVPHRWPELARSHRAADELVACQKVGAYAPAGGTIPLFT